MTRIRDWKSRQTRPRAILLSKRANVFYLEHARVIQMEDRVVYLTQDGAELERFFNIPERNTAFLLLGKGTSITDAAARRLAESNVMVGFCGSGGSPLFGALDLAFLAPQSEYRPTKFMQAWVRMWVDERERVALARTLLLERADFTARTWVKDAYLSEHKIVVPANALEAFRAQVKEAQDTQTLLLAEARWAKMLYAALAAGLNLDFSRREGQGKTETTGDIANGFIDHGNYIAYGYSAVALCGLGISFSLPILHGKTRRGALVFDIADLVKDAFVLPMAFASAKNLDSQREFRDALIDRCQEHEVLDYLFAFVSGVCDKYT